jgi:hypothetical protein
MAHGDSHLQHNSHAKVGVFGKGLEAKVMRLSAFRDVKRIDAAALLHDFV